VTKFFETQCRRRWRQDQGRSQVCNAA